jgi:hypothetical protein
MNDEYAGLAGTFIVDAVNGIRVPIVQYEAEHMAIKDIAPEKIINPSEAN